MFPWMMIANALVFAILLIITVVPPLYIYNPEQHPGESLGPPTAGGIFPDSDLSHSVRQKLYILFILPTCSFLNALFLYFSYYRHLRQVQFRVELNSVAHSNLRLAASMILQDHLRSQGSNALGATSLSNRSFFALGSVGNKSLSAFANNNNNNNLLYSRRRHTRPEGISRHAYASTPCFPELKELQKVVEEEFLNKAEAVRNKALDSLYDNILIGVERENNLRLGGLREAVVLLLEKQSMLVSEQVMKMYLAQVEVEKRLINVSGHE